MTRNTKYFYAYDWDTETTNLMQHNQAKFRIDTVVDAIFNAIFHLYTKNVVFFLHFNILMFEIFKKKNPGWQFRK